MKSTLFISDLHLDPIRPAVTGLFLDFLAGEARRAAALYILGDLFEAWLGDDDPDPHHARVAEALRALADANVPVHFLVGNRDFLLAENYARRAGMELLDEPVVLDLHGTPTVILHGDVLCTDDKEYQAFRNMVRNPDWQKDFLARPLEERRALAGQAREMSQARGQSISMDIMDVNADAVAALFREQGVPRMIHGHTHRPAIHDLEVDGNACRRIVLGDWYEQGSVLRVTEAGADLATLPLRR
ncbi:MAG: UDP-2,3-diacylglucosamine diphosphatase [Gammaproteobacteria bacterium]|nr:UDP-2,3-diacylglucosamine diphosphatase [Gammaproteobacteria bacterium]